MIPDLAFTISAELAQVQVTAADLEPAALHQVERMQARTASGVDWEGNAWAPYAPGDRKQGTVTLGDLAECIEMEADPEGITLAIAGEKGQIADYHNNGTRRILRRHFFDVSPADVEAMTVEITERIQARPSSTTSPCRSTPWIPSPSKTTGRQSPMQSPWPPVTVTQLSTHSARRECKPCLLPSLQSRSAGGHSIR